MIFLSIFQFIFRVLDYDLSEENSQHSTHVNENPSVTSYKAVITILTEEKTPEDVQN